MMGYDYRPTAQASAGGQSQGVMPHDRCKRRWQLYVMLNIAKLIVKEPLSKAELLSRGLRFSRRFEGRKEEGQRDL
jgi:hypothetical protein